jgi:PAS domain S-box-containing protein
MSAFSPRLDRVSPRRLRLLLVAGFLCANLLVLGVAGFALYQSKLQHEMCAQVQTRNLTEAIAQNVTNGIDKIDLTLQAVTDELERQLAAGRIEPRVTDAALARHLERMPELEAIRVADAVGFVILGKGVRQDVRANWADRDYFVRLREHRDAGLQIAKARIGRVARQYIVAFVRRYNNPDGSFAGVVSASVTLDHFATMLANFNAGPQGTLALRDADLGLIVRHPPIPDKPGGKLGNTLVAPELRAMLAAGAPAGTYYTDQSADGNRRIVSFQRIHNAHMLVAVGVERGDYLTDWRGEAFKTFALACSFILLSLLSAAFLLHLLNRFLRESARNERFLQCASDGIHVLDGQGNLVDVNDRFCAMLGYARDELVGKSPLLWDAQALPATMREALAALLAQQGTVTYERRHRRKDGEFLDVEINAAPFELDGARYVFASARDIGERKRAEVALLEAKRAAEAANLAKSQFLATMSHEIRTPLNGVLGMAQLLLMPELPETERQEYARAIINSGQTLLTLLNDILDLSKIDAGRMELMHADFAPRQLVEEVAVPFAEIAQHKGLRLEAAWHGPPGQRYWGDPIRLRQMLSNLLGNAVKFTASGNIRLAGRETADGMLEFIVADTGIGIADDVRDKLFKSFSQVDGSATRAHGGTGLGLSIVRSLADLMGGDVGVESVPGLGSSFSFRVRLQRVPDGIGQPDGQPYPAAGSAHRILVVEDDATNRQVIEAILDKCGYEHRSVVNGREAVRLVTQGESEWQPELVLMDCQMPVLNGFAATVQIRTWEAVQRGSRHLPIVALTAAAFQEDRERCLAVGMDDVLTKPVDMRLLQTTLQQWLSGRT